MQRLSAHSLELGHLPMAGIFLLTMRILVVIEITLSASFLIVYLRRQVGTYFRHWCSELSYIVFPLISAPGAY